MSFMPNPLSAPVQDTGTFWSIERVVAWIVGPIVSAGAGWLSLFLADNVPGLPTVSGEAIYALAGTATLSTAALFHKWLHGRQVMPPAVVGELKTLEANPMIGGFIHTTLADLEGVAQHAAAKAVAEIRKATPGSTTMPGAVVDESKATAPPPPDPIPPATNDPAPATPVAVNAGQAADAGVAPVA